MKTNKLQLLPTQFVNQFYTNLNLKDILLNLHRITKLQFQQKSTVNYNLNAYLSIEKCRKVAQIKENAFIQQTIKNIQHYHTQITNKNPTSNYISKINLTELSKFAQLFYQKKSQLSYLKTIISNISLSLSLNEKQCQRNTKVIEKMENILKQIEQKLIIVIEKYQQNTQNVHFVTQNFKCTYQNIEIQKKQVSGLIEDKLNQKIEYNPKNNVKKINDLSTNQQKIGNLNQKIISLKSQYRRLNCKKIWSNNVDNQNIKSEHKSYVINCSTEPNEQAQNMKTDEENNDFINEQGKYSIKVKRQKSTKHSSSFSIYNKSSKHSSFIGVIERKNDSIQGISNLPKEVRKYLQVKGQQKQRSILKKKSTVFNFINKDNLVGKKSINSVHRQSGFRDDARKSKLHEKRASMSNMRQMTQLEIYPKRQSYLKRASRTQPDMAELTLNLLCIEKVDQCSQLKSKSTIKLSSNLNIQQEQNQEKDEQQTFIQKTYGNLRSKKDKNRWKGFSKKHIDIDEESDNFIVQKPALTKRRSSLWNDISLDQIEPKSQQNEDRLQQQSQDKINNGGFDSFRRIKKLVHKKNRTVCEQLGNDEIQTQKTIKTNMLGRTKKYIKGHQNAVDSEDCAQLYKSITRQWGKDKQDLFSWCLQNMMRKKYDCNCKPLQEDNYQFDLNQSKPSNKLKIKVIQSQTTTVNHRKSNWAEQYQSFNQIDFSKIISKKINQLGQKSIEKNIRVSTVTQDLQTIYI